MSILLHLNVGQVKNVSWFKDILNQNRVKKNRRNINFKIWKTYTFQDKI